MSATITTVSCEGNSETCFCLSGTCKTQSSFSIKTLSAASPIEASTTSTAVGTSTLAATATSSSTPAQNTSIPAAPTPAPPHRSLDILPIALAVTIPLALAIILFAALRLWRRLHPRSHAWYASYCPIHNLIIGILAILQRWKLTRIYNRSVRRGHIAEKLTDDVGLTGSSSTATFARTCDANETDPSTSRLAVWRRKQQGRLETMKLRTSEVRSKENVKVLRRVELERVRRLREQEGEDQGTLGGSTVYKRESLRSDEDGQWI